MWNDKHRKVSTINDNTAQSKPSLTMATYGTILRSTWVGDVKRVRAILVLFLLGAAVCTFALPRVDLPETAFNEADAPINLAPPVRPSIRVTPPAVGPILVLPTLQFHSAVGIDSSLLLESAAVPRQRHQHSLQALLCTLLI
jgi:hypothetical protein